MLALKKEIMREIVALVDWNSVMLEFFDEDPAEFLTLQQEFLLRGLQNQAKNIPGVNSIDQDELSRSERLNSARDRVMSLVTSAVRNKNKNSNDKIRAIKELRDGFGLNLIEAKKVVERWMVLYEQDRYFWGQWSRDRMGNYSFS